MKRQVMPGIEKQPPRKRLTGAAGMVVLSDTQQGAHRPHQPHSEAFHAASSRTNPEAVAGSN
jgi:hypothetical protein